MIGTIGHVAIVLAFLAALVSAIAFGRAAAIPNSRLDGIGAKAWHLMGLLVFVASGLLVWLIFQHAFEYYYVFNYTSKDLQAQYLWAAFYSGQEGSFLMWIIMSTLVGWGLLRWTEPMYRNGVMFFLVLTQAFLLSMVLGVEAFGIDIGASPFRLLRETMPNAPVFASNPDFVPADGRGLNDLLRSPWIVIHPPVLFLGFAMMTVPFAFALTALWKHQYKEWVRPALPWALAANVCLLTAIFLGGYWAYVTLSFGGYWAWDPVENASLVPWLIGTAGIHTMLIQRKRDTGVRSSLIFAILAYVLIVYETFLTRSGVLGEASVHSFVDLGLYNQLLAFMVAMVGLMVFFLVMRHKEMPSVTKEQPVLSRDVMVFAGAMTLFLLGAVILLGTSSPIIGRLFVENPTPPDIAFYTDWSLPFAIALAVLSVVGQLIWWKRTEDWEALATRLTWPVAGAAAVTIGIVLLAEIRNLWYMAYLLAAFLSLFANGGVLVQLIRTKPALTGGAVSHIGLAVLLVGFLGAAFDKPILDADTEAYNQAVMAGTVIGSDGLPVVAPVEMVELIQGQPKYLGNRYWVTFMEARITERNRPGEQEYTFRIQDGESGTPYFLTTTVYPMVTAANGGVPNWTVDPEVKMGLASDLYLYVEGSSLVERERKKAESGADISPVDASGMRTLRLKQGASAEADSFRITFREFAYVDTLEAPANSTIAIRAVLDVTYADSSFTIDPMFSIVRQDTTQRTESPGVALPGEGRYLQFTNVNPGTGEIELRIGGVSRVQTGEWVLLTIERKPLVAVVWLGTFLLMIGFSIAIFRRWNDLRRTE